MKNKILYDSSQKDQIRCRIKLVFYVYNVIICDDDPAFLDHLKQQLGVIIQQFNLQIKIYAFTTMEAISDHIIKKCDIAILDIDFAEKTYSGLDIAKRLRSFRSDAVIIFATNYIEYAPEGYEVQAFRYILKKDIRLKLENYFKQAIQHLHKNSETIKFKINGEIVDISLEHILYIEAQLHTVKVIVQTMDYRKHKEYIFYSSIGKLDQQLSEKGFLRVHKSYLVNMAHIKRYQCQKVVLDNGLELSASASRYAEQKNAICCGKAKLLMDNFISVSWILMEMISQFLFCNSFMQKRTWNALTYFLILLIITWIFVFSNYYTGNIPVIYVSILSCYILSFVCFKGSWPRRITAVLMCMVLLSVMDTIVVYAWSTLTQIGLEELYSLKYTYFTVGTLSKSISLFIAWLVYRFWPKPAVAYGQLRWLILATIFPIISLVMLIVIYDNFQHNEDLSIRALSFTIAIALGNIGIMYLINQLEKSEQEKQRIALLDQQMEIQMQSILALEKSYRAQRTASHEFNHHLSTIGALLESNHYEALSQYVRQLQKNQPARVFSINSHHPIIDAVLNQKYQTAKDFNIDMQVKINDLSNISIPNDALVVVLSNLLDNAIEASTHCSSEKIIRLSLILEETIFCTVENTTEPVMFVNDTLPSTKKGSQSHGYGVSNIRKILDGLQAEYAFRYEEGWFYFVAEIPN